VLVFDTLGIYSNIHVYIDFGILPQPIASYDANLVALSLGCKVNLFASLSDAFVPIYVGIWTSFLLLWVLDAS
jgi:hypothetical protein